ncbi:MAG: hypothetical protein H7Z40_06240, partial [Phycisphaerae bacterium]|nr:hypothetical protein [Gemmatimonadaceae bacterium]
MVRTAGDEGRTWKKRAWLVLLAGGILAPQATPCLAQSAPATQPGDSVFTARMADGYAAVAAGNQASALAAFDLAARLAPQIATPRVAAGYALLALKRNAEAIERFVAAVGIDENLDVVRRQLAYLYAGIGRNRDALVAFEWLRTRDRASAQDLQAIGNLNAMLGERELALVAFRSAATLAAQLADSAVLRDSRASIAVLTEASGGANSPGIFVELYVSPFYQERFDNIVTYGLGRVGASAGGWWRPAAYASLRLTRDTKSVGGMQPVLYSDNSLVPALGVRVQPGGRWFTLVAEAGAAYPLVSVTPRNWKRDLRAGVIGAYSNQHALTGKPSGVSLVTEIFGDVTWYERFDRNVISYVQWRESLRLVQGPAGSVDVFLRTWGAFDSRRTYYNRVVEGGGGVALHAGINRRASLYIEALGGHYLAERNQFEPARNYSDFRVMFVTGWSRLIPFGQR